MHSGLDPLWIEAEPHLIADDDGRGDPSSPGFHDHLCRYRRVGGCVNLRIWNTRARKPRFRLFAEGSARGRIHDHRFVWHPLFPVGSLVKLFEALQARGQDLL